MLRYPARFEPDDNGGYVVTFRDIPEAITQATRLMRPAIWGLMRY